jgi:lipid-binding SYLF domain-containing protein
MIKKEVKIMKLRSLIKNRKLLNAFYFTILSFLFLGILFAGQSFADKGKEIDMKADEALDRFYKHVKDGKEAIRLAKGVLILPSVKKGALIIGGEYGRGAMRIGGKTVDYYSMASGSIGFQIGGQAKDMIIAFNSSDGLKKFRESKGWEAGVDGNVALFTVGAGESAVSAMSKEPIVAFVFDVKGLIADMSIKGAKFSKLDLK